MLQLLLLGAVGAAAVDFDGNGAEGRAGLAGVLEGGGGGGGGGLKLGGVLMSLERVG